MAEEEEEEPLPPYVYAHADGREGAGPRDAGVTETVSVGDKSVEVTLLGARATTSGDKAKATFPNGDTYTGGYFAGVREGQGTYLYHGEKPEDDDGDEAPPPRGQYEGGWKKGQKNGLGVMTYKDGSKYHGAWRDGKREGEGTFYYANGDIYSGAWQKGKKHGQGTYFYKESGAELVGTWSDGVICEGSFSDQSGGVYKGHFTGDNTNIAYVPGGVFTLASGAVSTAA